MTTKATSPPWTPPPLPPWFPSWGNTFPRRPATRHRVYSPNLNAAQFAAPFPHPTRLRRKARRHSGAPGDEGPPQQHDVRVRIKGFSLWRQQFSALLVKNYLLALRNLQSSTIRLLAPLIFMLIIFGFDQVRSQQKTMRRLRPNALPYGRGIYLGFLSMAFHRRHAHHRLFGQVRGGACAIGGDPREGPRYQAYPPSNPVDTYRGGKE